MTRVTSIVARKRQYVVDAAPGEPSTASAPSNFPSADPEKRAKARRRIEDAKDIVLERTYRKKNDSQVRAKRPQGMLSLYLFRSFVALKSRTRSAKAAATEHRRIRRIEERNAGTTCFACRQSGHSARDCPNAVSVEEGKNIVGMCYR
jgi:Zinc knuckle